MALPKLSTGALNIYADPHLGSATSPTTSPAASSKQEDSDPNYTLNYEEPVYFCSLEAQQLFDYGNYPVLGVGWGLVVSGSFDAGISVGDGVRVGCLAHHFQVI